MLHKQFEVEHQNAENVANTVEMAASSSKLLQIAWKMDRTGNPNKILTWRQIQKKKKNEPFQNMGQDTRGFLVQLGKR